MSNITSFILQVRFALLYIVVIDQLNVHVQYGQVMVVMVDNLYTCKTNTHTMYIIHVNCTYMYMYTCIMYIRVCTLYMYMYVYIKC